MNNISSGMFKPLVKLMKWLRRVNPTIAKKPKGIVIECIVAGCMDKSETQYGELFVKNLSKRLGYIRGEKNSYSPIRSFFLYTGSYF